MQPHIQINFLAIGLAVLGSFMLGFLWYSFLFNKSWMKEMGHDGTETATKSQMFRSLGLNFIGTLLMVWVLSHNQQAWDARTWGHASNFVSDYYGAFMGAMFTWIGFYLPQDLNKISFQNKSWKLFGIDTSYNLCSLLVAAFILTSLK